MPMMKRPSGSKAPITIHIHAIEEPPRRRGLGLQLLFLALAVAAFGTWHLELMHQSVWRIPSLHSPQRTSPQQFQGHAPQTEPQQLQAAGTALPSAPEQVHQPTSLAGQRRSPAEAIQKHPAAQLEPKRLLLSTHSRLIWYYPDSGEATVLHEGEVRFLFEAPKP